MPYCSQLYRAIDLLFLPLIDDAVAALSPLLPSPLPPSIPIDNPSFFPSQVIAAEGEQKASRALREAANVIAESSSALQVSSHLSNTSPSHLQIKRN